MSKTTPPSKKLRQAVDAFWETYPPLWRKIQAHIRQVAEERFAITVEQFHILRFIRRGRDSVSALAEAKNISRPAISQAVDLLVTRGLILRTVDSEDRRHVNLELTPDGNALMDSVFGDARQWMMESMAPLSASEIETLIRSLESLRKIL